MALSHKTIALNKTGIFSKLFSDYLNHSEKLSEFIAFNHSLIGFKYAIELRKNYSINRNVLHDAIIKQYEQSGILTDKIQALTNDLKLENTFTICTGHQLCLFTGPLYFIYKIVSTVNLAKCLKQAFPDKNFIPVFWMASEDHDFEEVNHLHVFGKKVTWTKSEHSGEEPIGILSNKGLEEVFSELALYWGTGLKAEELKKLFEKAYLQTDNISKATRILVNELFKDTDLLILDPNDANLKSLFIEYMQRDITEHVAYNKINESLQKLEALGYKSQVHPREINLFYFENNKRKRIVKNSDGTFQLHNSDKKYSKEALISILKNHPENFSPNVSLRPLYQQIILPNLAYVGGPGEIAYWLEYKSFFETENVFFPILTPRNFATIIDARARQLMEKTGIYETILFTAEEDKIKYFIQHATDLPDTEKVKFEIENAYTPLLKETEKIDVTLKPFVEAELQKSLKSLDAIRHKLERAQKQKNENAINQIKKLHEKIFPSGTLQERHENFSSIYTSEGMYFIKYLLENFDPFSSEMYLIYVTA